MDGQPVLHGDGERLELNFATSAAGTVKVEIQNADGTPVDGFALGDCHELFGDSAARDVAWKNDPSLRELAGSIKLSSSWRSMSRKRISSIT